MCSTSSASLAQVCRAIEELAARSGSGSGADDGGAGPGDSATAGPPGDNADDDIAARLAEAWAMIANANPEVARRVPGYLKAAE
jgi:hypothetical protein